MPVYKREVTSAWQWVVYYKESLYNVSTRSETIVGSGKYVSADEGISIVGKKITEISTTLQIWTEHVAALRFDYSQLSRSHEPDEATFRLGLLSVVANAGFNDVTIKIKTFRNDSFPSWNEDSALTFDDIYHYDIPIDEMSYSETFEDTALISSANGSVTFDNVIIPMWKFLNQQTHGFQIQAENGYAEIFDVEYISTFLRPRFNITQIGDKQVNFMNMECAVIGKAKVKGTCRNKRGDVITGSACDITVFDPDTQKVLGTGTSTPATGGFLVTVDSKVGNAVIVSFANTTENISGAEIMNTVSYDTV